MITLFIGECELTEYMGGEYEFAVTSTSLEQSRLILHVCLLPWTAQEMQALQNICKFMYTGTNH